MVTFKWDDKRANEIAREEGKEEAKNSVVLNMIKNRFEIKTIANVTELSVEQVQRIAASNGLLL